jgi:diguanylate cyclase (GGDEF)-like protein
MVNTSPGLDFQDLDMNVSCLSDTLVVPIRQHDVCLGTISLYAGKPLRYGEAHLGIVQIVGNQIAPMLADALCKSKKTPDALDTVTGLPKVSYLAAAGAQLIERCGFDGSTFHLIHLRIKNMAQLVELYGPPVRDWILHRAAKVLTGEIRQSDIATRYGRDGFVLLMPGVKAGQLFRRVQRVTELISAIQLQDGSAVFCEVGSACYPQAGTSIFTLLDAAQHSTLDLAKEIGSESESKVLDFPA